MQHEKIFAFEVDVAIQRIAILSRVGPIGSGVKEPYVPKWPTVSNPLSKDVSSSGPPYVPIRIWSAGVAQASSGVGLDLIGRSRQPASACHSVRYSVAIGKIVLVYLHPVFTNLFLGQSIVIGPTVSSIGTASQRAFGRAIQLYLIIEFDAPTHSNVRSRCGHLESQPHFPPLAGRWSQK